MTTPHDAVETSEKVFDEAGYDLLFLVARSKTGTAQISYRPPEHLKEVMRKCLKEYADAERRKGT